MQGLPARAAQAYAQTHVQSRSPLELVVMLYDGLLRFVGDARSAINARDLPGKRTAVSRALAIVSELQSTLNMEVGGEVASALDGLYTYINGRLLEASMQSDAAALDECERLVRTLREPWAELATREVTTLAAGGAPR
jgi:flagellar secretion chaperone FliS